MEPRADCRRRGPGTEVTSCNSSGLARGLCSRNAISVGCRFRGRAGTGTHVASVTGPCRVAYVTGPTRVAFVTGPSSVGFRSSVWSSAGPRRSLANGWDKPPDSGWHSGWNRDWNRVWNRGLNSV